MPLLFNNFPPLNQNQYVTMESVSKSKLSLIPKHEVVILKGFTPFTRNSFAVDMTLMCASEGNQPKFQPTMNNNDMSLKVMNFRPCSYMAGHT